MPRPPVTVVTDPVSDRLRAFATVHVIWTPLPSGLVHDAVGEMALS